MTKRKKSIAIDMDNVIADIEQHMINWYHQRHEVLIEKHLLHGQPEGAAFPDRGKVKELLFTPGFFRTAPVIEGAREALLKLYHDFDVYIVSAAMEFPQSLIEKYEWMKEHFPFVSWKKIVFCGDKNIVDTDFMIDDHLKNLDNCKGTGILYTACHNMSLDFQLRVENWREALDFLYGYGKEDAFK